jgi:hypothetical protein
VGVCIRGALRSRGMKVVVFVHDISLGPSTRHIATQSVNFLFHLGVLRAFADALEVGLNLAFELQAVAPRTTMEGFLDDVAPQLD